MLRQMRRSIAEIQEDSPCIGTCTLDEDDVCVGCWRHIDDIPLSIPCLDCGKVIE